MHALTDKALSGNVSQIIIPYELHRFLNSQTNHCSLFSSGSKAPSKYAIAFFHSILKTIEKKVGEDLINGTETFRRKLMDLVANESGEHYVTVSDPMGTILKLEKSSQQNKTGISNEINRVKKCQSLQCLRNRLIPFK